MGCFHSGGVSVFFFSCAIVVNEWNTIQVYEGSRGGKRRGGEKLVMLPLFFFFFFFFYFFLSSLVVIQLMIDPHDLLL